MRASQRRTDPSILDIGLFLFNNYRLCPTGPSPTLGLGTQSNTRFLPSGSLGPEEAVSGELSGCKLTNCSEEGAVCRELVCWEGAAPGPRNGEDFTQGLPRTMWLESILGACQVSKSGGDTLVCKGTEVCCAASEHSVAAEAPSGTRVSPEARAQGGDHHGGPRMPSKGGQPCLRGLYS